MSNYEYLNNFKEKMRESDSLEKSLNDVHCKGLFSLVVGGNENGRLLRVFIAHKKIKAGQIQYHSHRYPIKLTTLKGEVINHVARNGKNVLMDRFKYHSPLNGGDGLRFYGSGRYDLFENTIPIGCSIDMDSKEIHTVSCSKGSIWIVEEQGFESDFSTVLGTPFITADLYRKPEQFQINDNYQLVKNCVNQILNSYIGVLDYDKTKEGNTP